MQLVPLPQLSYYHIFVESDGSESVVKTTKQEYEALAYVEPVRVGATRKSSHARFDIPIGTFADDGNNLIVGVAGGVIPILKSMVLNNELTAKGLNLVLGIDRI